MCISDRCTHTHDCDHNYFLGFRDICTLIYERKTFRKNSKAKGTKRVVVDGGRCACCLAPFLVGRGVRCSDCGARSCRKACSRWDTSDNAWHCIFCHQQRSWLKRNDKWFDNFGGTADEEEELHKFFGIAKSRVHAAEHAAAISNVEIQEDREERRMVHAVRNFIEKIVDGLVENVDDTSIDRIYWDSEYDRFLEKYRPPLITVLTRLAVCLEASLMNKPSTDPPAMAHAALREIVERAVEEARKLPGLSASTDAEPPQERRAVADNSYEDLLATAILNKVIERYQRERVDGNSNVLDDTDSSKAKYTANESEHGLEEDGTSYTSDRLACNGDQSASIRRNEDCRKPVSFTMEERIEEVTTITSDDDEHPRDGVLEFDCTRRVPFPEYGMDIVDPPRELPSPSSSSSSDSDLHRNEYSPVRTKRHVGSTMDIVSPIESWEDNWLFQKKKTSRSQPDAVAMLVPSSNAYYKALIGDRDAEDTSDLSECSSTKSDEEIEKELMEAINNVIPRTPRISECDAANNQTESNQEGATMTQQFGKDEVDTSQTITENNVTICESFDRKNHKELLKSSEILEKETNKHKDDKGNRNESSLALITVVKEDKTKKKFEDTVEHDERIATAVESSAQKEVNMQSEKSSERCDRGENIADENEEQRESEYTEHYDTAIQRHLDSLTKVEVCSGENETVDETRKTMDEQFRKSEDNSIKEPKSERSETEVQLSATIDENHADMTNKNDPLSAPPRPGTIAEREHKKWENAPPIENNPYSEESIRKRCLEKQYSRNSDIPGAHYELTKLNEANLETLLTPGRPDIKRFGRDYYINQSKVTIGERQERAKSAMSSMSSRPSSSLSQSSYAGDEQHEQQVSHDELKQFEAASLRGSLPRRCCRDTRASSHFAINPLLHLESANDRSRHERADNHVGNDDRMNPEERESMKEDIRDDREPKNVGAIFEKEEDNYVLTENLEAGMKSWKLVPTDWNRPWENREGSVDRVGEEPIVPQYENCVGDCPGDRDDRDPGDHDSGMCSIGSRDSEGSERDRWRRLYRVADNDRPGDSGQILSIGSRKFWTTGGYKFHTFGGIRIRPKKTEVLDDDLEDESTSLENSFEDRSPEFARLKFQTFGGIKRSRKIDRRIPNYRRIRLRPILPEVVSVIRGAEDGETEGSANFELHSNVNSENCNQPTNLNCSTSFERFEHSSSTFEESDWQDEENDITNNQISTRHAQIRRNRNRTNAFRVSSMTRRRNPTRKKNTLHSPSLWSLPNEDDKWQDEIDCIPDEIIMNKFLKNVSKRRKAYAFNDDDIAAQERGARFGRQSREVLEVNSEKLRKSITRNTERNLQNLKESSQEEKGDDKERCKKLYVRSLSDVTIW